LNLSKILPQYLKFWAKLLFQNFDKNENIGERSIFNFLTIFLRGQGNSSGKRRDIAKSFAETLGKILAKCCEFKISPKPQQ